MADFPLRLMVDTGYWLAVCDSRDSRHNLAATTLGEYERHGLLLPWPCVYETLRTRFVARPAAIRRFAAMSKRSNVERLDDSKYRDDAYEAIVSTASRRPMSLVDMVMRLMLEDVEVRVNRLLTFNPKDFHDVCRKRSLTMP